MRPPVTKRPPPYPASGNQSPERIVSTKLQMKLLLTGHLYLAPFGRPNEGFLLSLPLLSGHPKLNPRSLALFCLSPK